MPKGAHTHTHTHTHNRTECCIMLQDVPKCGAILYAQMKSRHSQQAPFYFITYAPFRTLPPLDIPRPRPHLAVTYNLSRHYQFDLIADASSSPLIVPRQVSSPAATREWNLRHAPRELSRRLSLTCNIIIFESLN